VRIVFRLSGLVPAIISGGAFSLAGAGDACDESRGSQLFSFFGQFQVP